jgi:hypothetical protein
MSWCPRIRFASGRSYGGTTPLKISIKGREKPLTAYGFASAPELASANPRTSGARPVSRQAALQAPVPALRGGNGGGRGRERINRPLPGRRRQMGKPAGRGRRAKEIQRRKKKPRPASQGRQVDRMRKNRRREARRWRWRLRWGMPMVRPLFPPSTETSMTQDSPSEAFHDLLRGVAALTRKRDRGRYRAALRQGRPGDLSIACNHKQIASKQWLVEALAETLPRPMGRSGCSAPGMACSARCCSMMPQSRSARSSASISIRAARTVAETLNHRHVAAGRFRAVTADMMALDFAAQVPAPGLVINTSCEHLDDVPGWLATLPAGLPLLLQSNDYVREPDHRSCVPRSRPSRAGGPVRGLVRGRAADEELYALHADRRGDEHRARAAVAIAMKGYPRLSETFIAQELLGLQQRGLPSRSGRCAIPPMRSPSDAQADHRAGALSAGISA